MNVLPDGDGAACWPVVKKGKYAEESDLDRGTGWGGMGFSRVLKIYTGITIA
jgi:hypothetical protein